MSAAESNPDNRFYEVPPGAGIANVVVIPGHSRYLYEIAT